MMPRLRMFVPALLLTLALAPAAFAADAGSSFTLIKDGKPIGKTSYTVSKTKDGYKVRSRYEYRVNVVSKSPDSPAAGTPTDSQYTAEYSTLADGSFVSGYNQNAANQMITSYQPTKARDALVVSQLQGGNSSSGQPLAVPTVNFLFAPDYDPSGIQLLVLAAIAHPHNDFRYTLLTPGSGAKPATTFNYIAMKLADDAPTGTLDGKEITLKHFQVNYAKGKADFYTDADGNLMQANMGTLNTNYIRAKFVLPGK